MIHQIKPQSHKSTSGRSQPIKSEDLLPFINLNPTHEKLIDFKITDTLTDHINLGTVWGMVPFVTEHAYNPVLVSHPCMR